jgi:hypothetical protein
VEQMVRALLAKHGVSRFTLKVITVKRHGQWVQLRLPAGAPAEALAQALGQHDFKSSIDEDP